MPVSAGDQLTQVISFICIVVWLTNYKSFLEWENKAGSAWVPDFATVKFNFVKCTASTRPLLILGRPSCPAPPTTRPALS